MLLTNFRIRVNAFDLKLKYVNHIIEQVVQSFSGYFRVSDYINFSRIIALGLQPIGTVDMTPSNPTF